MTRIDLPAETPLWKAHGTGNSFVLVDDPDARLDLDATTVSALCSPRFGIGADGLIRCVCEGGTWFMDYRNADGSLAEMCGNGVRVFVDHLRRRGFVDVPRGGGVEVLTRGGLRSVAVVAAPEGAAEDEWYDVDMGPARSTAAEDVRVEVPGVPGEFTAIRVAMPNPHAVVDLDSSEALTAAALPTVDVSEAPEVLRPRLDPAPADGVNLELTVDLTEDVAQEGHLLMRVLERGVGETASCGTGCCAAAVAAAIRRGPGAPVLWDVDVPGGRVRVGLAGVVEWDATGASARVTDAPVHLIGPATPVARIDLGA